MAKRSWYFETNRAGEIDLEGLAARLDDLMTCISSIGGAVMFGVDRREMAPGKFADHGVYVEYNTFVQARHLEAMDEHDPEEDPGETDPGEEDREDGVTNETQPEFEPAVTLE